MVHFEMYSSIFSSDDLFEFTSISLNRSLRVFEIMVKAMMLEEQITYSITGRSMHRIK
jgi:response regulator of citrate/malate metabolism